jgi:hypothetical protein
MIRENASSSVCARTVTARECRGTGGGDGRLRAIDLDIGFELFDAAEEVIDELLLVTRHSSGVQSGTTGCAHFLKVF